MQARIILDEIVLATDLLLGIVQAGIIQPRVSSEKYLARVGEVFSLTQFRDTGWLLLLVFDVFVFRPETLCEFYPLLPQTASFVVVHILLAPFFFLRAFAFVRAFTESIIRYLVYFEDNIWFLNIFLFIFV